MIGYVTLGTNDIHRAGDFYDGLLAELGAGRFMDEGNFIAWAVDPNKPALSVAKPADGNIATVGNGVMVALSMKDPAAVDAFYAKAMELGARDEGAPGPRGSGGFLCGLFS